MKLSLLLFLTTLTQNKPLIEVRNKFDEFKDSPTSMALYRRGSVQEIEPLEGDELPEVKAFGYNANTYSESGLFGIDLGLNFDLGVNYELPLYNQD